MAEFVALGHLLHFGAGIGDGEKVTAGLVGSDSFFHLFEEVLLQDIGLKRGAGFAGDHDERFGEVDLVARGFDLRRVGGVDDVGRGKAGLRPKRHGQYLGTKTRPAHPEQKNGLKPGGHDVGGEGGMSGSVFLLALDDIDPSQPLFFAVAGPEGWVLLPEAVNLVVGLPVGGGLVDDAAKLWG